MQIDAAAAFSLLTAQAVRERAHRMLAIGLDDRSSAFSHRSVTASMQRSTSCWRRCARPILARHTVSFALAPFRDWRQGSLGGDRGRDAWPDRRRAGARRVRPCDRQCTARCRRRARVALSRPATGWQIGRSGGTRAREPRDVRGGTVLRPNRTSRCGLMRDALKVCRSLICAKDCKSRTTIRWIGSRAGPTCCAGSGAWSRPRRRFLPAMIAPRPGGLFDHLATQSRWRRASPRPQLCRELLHQLGPIWPSRLPLGGIPLGDCWRHPGSRPMTRPTGSCRCTSSRNGSPIR